MILAAGLSPAWQQVLVLDRLQPGEVNRAREAVWCASGKVLNVGLALHHLGGPSLTLSLLGGLPADAINAEFAALGVPRRWVRSQAATRVCTTLLDQASGQTTELVENARSIAADELAEFERVYAEVVAGARFAVLTGSLPAGAPPTLFRDLLSHTRCPVLLDMQREPLLAALDARPLVVKPNREELGNTLGRAFDSDADLHRAMHELNDRGAQWVVVSHGKHTLWATSSGNLLQFEPPPVDRVVNPIGCGDCLAAGIAWGLTDGRPMEDAIRLGLAAAAENAQHLLPGRVSTVPR